MVAGQSAPRYQEMALLYPQSSNLKLQLSEYFIVIVNFCHHALKMTKKSVLGQLLSFPSESDLNSFQSDLTRWANSIKDEVGLLMGQAIKEQSSSLEFLLRHSKHQSQRQRQKTRIRILNVYSTYDHQTTWRQIRKAGNTSLLHQMPDYQNWKARVDSCTLICTGKLGSGKSVLLANIIDDLNLEPRSSKCPVAYFFCRHDVSESLRASTIIGSLVRQLLNSIPDLSALEKIIDEAPSVEDPERTVSMLRRVLPPQFVAYFILDGSDECGESEALALIEQLGMFQRELTLLICLSSRSEAGDVSRLNPGQLARQVTIAVPEKNPDIGIFVHAELAVRITSGRLTIGDPTLILEIEDALVRGAQGMFLWVVLQIESLRTAETDEAIRQALTNLPKDLSQTFSRLMQKTGELGADRQSRILQLVTAARRPLTTQELREALSVVPGDTDWNPARLLNNVHSALACCGCLLTVDEEDATVRLVHESFKQFLLGEFRSSDSATATFTNEEANRTMGDIIITYLSYGVFDAQISTVKAPQLRGLADAAPRKVVQSMGARNNVGRLALKLLESRRTPGFDVGKVLAEAGGHFTSPSTDQFQFVSYARSFWPMHILYVSDLQTSMRSLIRQFGRRNTVTVDMRDDESGLLLVQAAQEGRLSIVELLLELGLNIESKAENGQTPLFLAAREGHEAVVGLLLDKGADIESKAENAKTPLSWAAQSGHEAVVELLLDKGTDIDSKAEYGQTPLSCAAWSGQKAVVELLLDKGANIESKAENGMIPLSYAAESRHKAVVELLREKTERRTQL